MKTSAETAPPMLKAAREALAELDDFTEEGVHDLLIGLAGKLEVKNGQLMWPVRVALSGEPVTPGGAVEIAVLLGKEETLKRLDDAIAALE